MPHDDEVSVIPPTRPTPGSAAANACAPIVNGDEAGCAVSRLRYAREKSTCWYKEGC